MHDDVRRGVISPRSVAWSAAATLALAPPPLTRAHRSTPLPRAPPPTGKDHALPRAVEFDWEQTDELA